MKRTIAACMIFSLALCIISCGEESGTPLTEEVNRTPITEAVQDSVSLPTKVDTLIATKEKQEPVVVKPEQKKNPEPGKEKQSIEAKEKPETPSASPEDVSAGKALLTQSDCLACHKVDEKAIGPSYSDVAKKYPKSEATIQTLANKIISGGAGVWGQIPMSPHPALKHDDAEKMVAYILSLK